MWCVARVTCLVIIMSVPRTNGDINISMCYPELTIGMCSPHLMEGCGLIKFKTDCRCSSDIFSILFVNYWLQVSQRRVVRGNNIHSGLNDRFQQFAVNVYHM